MLLWSRPLMLVSMETTEHRRIGPRWRHHKSSLSWHGTVSCLQLICFCGTALWFMKSTSNGWCHFRDCSFPTVFPCCLRSAGVPHEGSIFIPLSLPRFPWGFISCRMPARATDPASELLGASHIISHPEKQLLHWSPGSNSFPIKGLFWDPLSTPRT